MKQSPNDFQQKALLALARDSIYAALKGEVMPPSHSGDLIFQREQGLFVTLHAKDMNGTPKLRGCIGYINATESLGNLLPKAAVQAAFHDSRFPPLTLSELSNIQIEISLLGEMESFANPEDIEIGIHGLIVEDGMHRGVLLPQVAVEWGFDVKQFLAQTCRKAGLSENAWRNGAKLYRFRVDLFGED